ncbi:hypothetical protein C0J52_15328 [Blattella germanica]|nr:hypothetical protein C0J52_15328 [Blattella germanica]
MVLGISTEVLLIAVPLFLWAFYWYSTNTFKHWKKKGVYYKEPVMIFGNIKDRILFRRSFHEFQQDVYKMFEGHKYAGKTEEAGEHELEMKEFFGRFTLDVIGSCAFGVECSSLKDKEAEFVNMASRFNDISFLSRIFIFIIVLFVPQFARFFPLNFFNKEALLFLVDVVKKTKEYRRAHKDRKWNDFLQLMIDAAEEDVKQNEKENVNVNSKNKKPSETSSTLLTHASYELALNEDIQTKLRNEIKDTLAKHDGECSYDALSEMNYLEMVLLEALRKHPPVARVDRTCTQPYKIPGTDIELDVNTNVSIPIMGLHHDPQYYPQPDVFDPDRFLPEAKTARSPYVFLPFGSGPRNCIDLALTKWPFVRILGIQEPASVLFSIFNFVTHFMMFKEFRRQVRKTSPMYWLWQVYALVCLNCWFWSSVFHTRDTPFTEMMDYFSAFSTVLFSFYAMILRLLNGYSLFLAVLISFLCLGFFVHHVTYLAFVNFDYGYNMQANIVVGVANAMGWFIWCFYHRKTQPYVWRCALFVSLVGLCMLLEIMDFPPILWLVDAHSLWHLATAGLPFIFYQFLIDDCKHLRDEKEYKRIHED